MTVTELPIALEPYVVLQFWHESMPVDPASRWMRQSLAALLQ
jgi:hypothetical protein